MLNDSNAKLISKEDIYPVSANSPTQRCTYECPCGKGKIVSEQVVGFWDYTVRIECDDCKQKYIVVTGCGHFWELRLK